VVEAFAVLHPTAALVVAAVAVRSLPRRAGALAGVGIPLAATAWIATVPAGVHLQTTLFGFEVVLFYVDPVSRTVGTILAFVAAAAVAYGLGTGASRRQRTLSLLYLGAGLGAVFAGDWLTLVLAWEALAVAATALVWSSGDVAARRAGLRYAVYHEVGGLLLVAGVLLHYVGAGTFLFDGGFGGGSAALLGALGIGLNVGFVGLHPWLVDTYPRPHVATSVVLAACTTKVGVYGLARAFPDGRLVVAYVGGAMLLVGVTYAILQTDVRRLLSYHVVSQVGIMVAGIGVGTPLALSGAFAHLVNNVLYKSLLFVVAGLLIVRTGESSLERLGGLARSMPLTFGAFVVAALAIAGVPGFNGFVSKGMVFDATEAAGLDVLWWVLVVGSAGTVLSFLKFGYYAFVYGEAREDVTDVDGPGRFALAALALPCLLFGLLPGLQFAVLPGSTAAATPFAASQFVKAAGIFGAGSVAFVVLRTPLARVTSVPDLDAVYHPLGARATWAVTDLVGGGGARIDAAVERATEAAVRATTRAADRRTAGLPGAVRRDAIGSGVLLLALTLALLLLVGFL